MTEIASRHGPMTASEQGAAPKRLEVSMASNDTPRPLGPTLATRVEEALQTTGYSHHKLVVVSVEGGKVVLRGTVPSYYLKQIAHAAAALVAGPHFLTDEIRVAHGVREIGDR